MVPLRSVSYKLRGLPVRCAIYNDHPHRAHHPKETGTYENAHEHLDRIEIELYIDRLFLRQQTVRAP